ncbi:hypothetical protein [Amycolatopsis sp. 195334CR]|uniref:hypothetical protein n=1 Tax=Amycolatopsis sp. 195334CR TaxID=2814588 RepID=UPI001A90A0D2|nr:hypothetical protein [Amycolatopsis sp. 195334CR]MBN6035644.1 hypothetical protein [Amycolatopsis sp. 195334CR]
MRTLLPGAVSLLLAPPLLLAGVLLRLPHDLFFPAQLAAFAHEPDRVFAAYSCFLLGIVVLWPGILLLARRIGGGFGPWGSWGAVLVLFGLFARAFHAGIDHLAFQLVRVLGLDTATRVVAESYGAYHVLRVCTVPMIFGWVVLAIGAWRSRALGRVGAVALGAMTAMPVGVLKGTEWLSVVAAVGLCVALVPLGVRVLRECTWPAPAVVARWSALGVGTVTALYFLGQVG